MNRRAAFVSVPLLAVYPTLPAFASTPTHLWSQRLGGADYDIGRSVAVDGSGNVLVTGHFSGTVNFGGGNLESAGSFDVFLAKYDAAGVHQWSRRFGGPGDDHGQSVAVDGSGNVLVTGFFGETANFGGVDLESAGISDIFLAKYDAAGVHQWSRRFGGPADDHGESVAVDGSGNVFAAGYFAGTVGFGDGDLESAGSYDIFLAKYDAAGVHRWSQRFGGTGIDEAESVAVDGEGNGLITGFFDETVDFGGGGRVSMGEWDVFLAKYDPEGAHLWSNGYGGMWPDFGYSVAVDGAGNVFATGQFSGMATFGGGGFVSAGITDIFLAKYDADGAHQWSRGFGSPSDNGFDYGYSVAADGSGNVFTTGVFACCDRLAEIFVAKYDPMGTLVWSPRYGGGSRSGTSVAVDPWDDVLVTGFFGGRVDFGGGNLVSAGFTDIFLVKFAGTPPTAVAITSFEAQAHDGVVELRAVFRSDRGVEAVNVYRSEEETRLARIATVTDIRPERFEYADVDVTPGSTYRYQIGVIDGDGEFLSPMVVVLVNPLAARLEQNVPNPFNPATTIPFTLSEESRVTLSIYDAGGSLVRVLLDAVHEPGTHRVEWDGRDAHGAPMSSGVYFHRLQAGKFSESRKMVLVK